MGAIRGLFGILAAGLILLFAIGGGVQVIKHDDEGHSAARPQPELPVPRHPISPQASPGKAPPVILRE